jgi:hypothetical protein
LKLPLNSYFAIVFRA